jgi:hypothetical protein
VAAYSRRQIRPAVTVAGPAAAATTSQRLNQWYVVPAVKDGGGRAWAIMTSFNKGWASGSAGGQIYLVNCRPSRNSPGVSVT